MSHVLYRLYTFRRLIICCSVLPALTALALSIHPMGVAFGCLFLLSTMIAIWPHSTLEALAFSVTAALGVLAYAVISALYQATGEVQGTIFVSGITAFGAFFVWLGMIKAFAHLETISLGMLRLRSSCVVPLPLDQAIELEEGFFEGARTQKGPVQDDGSYIVTKSLQFADPDTNGVLTEEYAYRELPLPVESTDADAERRTQTTMVLHDETRVSVERTRFYSKRDKTIIRSEEVHDLFSVYAWTTYWLVDYHRDHKRLQLDAYLKRDSLSCAGRQDQNFLIAILRGMRRVGLVPDPSSDAPL